MTILEGEQSATISVATIADSLVEPTETMTLRIDDWGTRTVRNGVPGCIPFAFWLVGFERLPQRGGDSCRVGTCHRHGHHL